MKNQVLHALATFIASNYESIKKDYNALSKEQKSAMPITIFAIGIFDSLLTNQEDNDKVSEEPAKQA
jgi:Mg2+/citrate symporter